MKRNESIVPLSREHHLVLLFCWKIRAGIRANVSYTRMRDYVSYFWEQILYPHFMEEETCLFISRDDTLVKQALAEHKQLQEQVVLILDKSNKGISELQKLADMITDHTRFEERILFPHLEKTLSDIELERIGQSLYNAGHSLQDAYADQFWL